MITICKKCKNYDGQRHCLLERKGSIDTVSGGFRYGKCESTNNGNCDGFKHKRPSEIQLSFRPEMDELKETLDALFAKHFIVKMDKKKLPYNYLLNGLSKEYGLQRQRKSALIERQDAVIKSTQQQQAYATRGIGSILGNIFS